MLWRGSYINVNLTVIMLLLTIASSFYPKSLFLMIICGAKTKGQISFAVTDFFPTQIEQSVYFLNAKFQASGHLLLLYSPICVIPGRKPRRQVFLRRDINYMGVLI